MRTLKNLSIGRRVAGLASISLACIAITPNVFATPIPLAGGGLLLKSNQTGDLLAVTSTTPCIAFSGAAVCTSSTTTPFLVSGADPIFATGASGTIKDIGTTFPITAFETVGLTIAGGPAIFDLLNIIPPNPGLGPCGVSSVACAAGSFSFLQQTDNSVVISLALNEIGYLTSSSTGSTAYKGLFSTTVTGNLSDVTGGVCTGTDTIANILQCEGQGHTIRSTWSGTQSPVSGVPEPMTFSLMGAGLLGLGLISRRRKQS